MFLFVKNAEIYQVHISSLKRQWVKYHRRRYPVEALLKPLRRIKWRRSLRTDGPTAKELMQSTTAGWRDYQRR